MIRRMLTAQCKLHEAGFMMIEAVIATALVAVCAGAVLSAVLSIQHRTLFAQPSAALTLTAQNVLTDLRAATAYDGAELNGLGGRNADFDGSQPSPNGSPEPIHIRLSVSMPAANGALVAAVRVSDAQGRSAAVQTTLTREVPAPGSNVAAEAPSPALSPAEPPAATQSPPHARGPIAL